MDDHPPSALDSFNAQLNSKVAAQATPTPPSAHTDKPARGALLVTQLAYTLRPHPCRVSRCAQVKHEARAFDGERPCHRSVIVQFIRKPVKDGSDKILLDL